MNSLNLGTSQFQNFQFLEVACGEVRKQGVAEITATSANTHLCAGSILSLGDEHYPSHAISQAHMDTQK